MLLPVSEQRAYSFSSSPAGFVQFIPQSWLASAGAPVQHVAFKFKTHNPDGLLVFITDGAVAVSLTDGHIDVSTSAGGALVQDFTRKQGRAACFLKLSRSQRTCSINHTTLI